MASKVWKLTTGLTGLKVSNNPHLELHALYETTLKVLARMPSDAAYRKNTEAVVKHRLSVVKSETNPEQLEKKINCGQIEEVILQAERELSLARKMLQWEPWHPLVQEPPPTQWKWPL